jgi:hypothetical protein
LLQFRTNVVDDVSNRGKQEEFDMTTFVSQQQLTTPAVDAGRFVRALAGVRTWGKDYAGAFRATAHAPRREGMDPIALVMFGRD